MAERSISLCFAKRGRCPGAVCNHHLCFEIRYNLLNLASEVTGHDPEDTAAEGTQLSETVYYADGTRAGVMNPEDGYWTSRYIGSLIYGGEPGEEGLNGIQTADGFIAWRGSAANSQMQYFLRDHLGSVRVIASDRNTVISRSDYLPFGVRMTGSGLCGENSSARSSYFGFSGKENEMWDGLDVMSGNTPHWLKGERYQHFGARAYDPVTCIFMQIDPMAEKSYSYCEYGFCQSNPINRIDPYGAIDWDLIAKGSVAFAVGAASTVALVSSTVFSGGTASPLTVPLTIEAFGGMGLGTSYILLGFCTDNYENSSILPSSPSAAVATGVANTTGMEMEDAAEIGEAVSAVINVCTSSSKTSAALTVLNNCKSDKTDESNREESKTNINVQSEVQSESEAQGSKCWFDGSMFLFTPNIQ